MRRNDEIAMLLQQRYHAELCMEWARTNHQLELARLARKYDPNQPRVGAGNPAGGQWLGQNVGRGGSATSSGDGDVTGAVPMRGAARGSDVVAPLSSAVPSREPFNLIQPIQYNPALPSRPIPGRVGAAIGVIGAAIRLYNHLSETWSGTTVIEFTSREYAPSAANPFELAMTRTLSRSETQAYCPSLGMVQDLTDKVDREVRLEHPDYSPQNHGTEVHLRLKRSVEDNPQWGLKAEQSFLKERDEVPYGAKGSIRLDLLQKLEPQTVCIYDYKTGRAGLSLARATEMAVEALDAYKQMFGRYIVVEVRPSR